jgi:type II secretory ATPase GspE/PulE/Tfp pilus assembly ATPase PilB-like protein
MKLAAPIVSVPTSSVFAWPTPPFFQTMEAPAGGHGQDSSVELMRGRVIHGELLHFAPGAASIDIALRDRGRRHRINIEHVRTIRLATPLSLIRDVHVIEMSTVGNIESQGADERTFSIRFFDGRTFDGVTRGFVKEKGGLFLYLPKGKPHQAVRCFIPAQHVEDVQIGPLLGETLARKNQVSSSELLAALDQQAKFRQEKLGKLLSDRGIVSQEVLKRTLLSQEHRPAMKLGELLLETGLISPEQLNEALNLQAANRRRRLGDILVGAGIVTIRQVQMALSDKLGIPFVNLREFQIDPLALEAVGARFANRNQVLPLLLMGESLVVAVENPLAMDSAQELNFLTHHTIVPVIANPDDLRLRIAKEYAGLQLAGAIAAASAMPSSTADGTRGKDLTHMNVGDLAGELDRAVPPPRESVESESDARVSDNALVRLINKIIIDAHAQGASDIHIESNAGNANSRIRFRKDGEMEDYIELQPAYRNALVSRIKVMAGLDISEHRHAQDGKIAFGKFGPLQIELRVAVVPTSNNLEDVVLRILGGVEPLPLDKLGLGARDMAELKKMVSRSYGLILVCGPTGSGKTTTLHSVLRTINRPDIKIWTAEDPVEITQAGLRQVQINARIGWTFASAMRAFLRADPDVIMVGEMRDAETTKIGIEASLTGHLVFSTLHTNSASESVVRLIELGIDPFNFADALIGILSQRLARTLCTRCKKPRSMTDAEILDLAHEYCLESKLDPTAVIAQWRATYAIDGQLVRYETVGCDACSSGYKGRVGVYELLISTPQIKDVIRSRGSAPQVAEAAQRGGMRLLRQDAIEKVLSGVLDLASARTAST